MNKQPPKYPLRFFHWFCHPDYVEDIEGDLLERFEKRPSGWLFTWEVLKLLRPGIIKPASSGQKLNYYGMFKHNLLISIRGFKKHKASFLINLTGLATGLASAFLIFLWINNEKAVDHFNSNDERLYRVMSHFQLPNNKVTWEYTSGRMANSLKEAHSEVVKSTRVNNKFFIPKGVITNGSQHLEVTGQFADPTIFSIMSYDLISGDPKTALIDKNAVIISIPLAEKLFGDPKAAMGQNFNWNCEFFDKPFVVTGVFNPPPKNATRQFELMVSYENLIDADPWADHWNGGYAETYIELAEWVDPYSFSKKIADHYNDKVHNKKFTIFLQKYSDRYLFGQFEDGELVGGRIANVRLFSYIALLIILIAAINFINLSTAQASMKLKQIGVKKAMGGNKKQLVFQFLTESTLMSLFSMIGAVVLVYSLLPYFNQLIDQSLTFALLDIIPTILIAAISLGLIAGLYPAFYLSSFRPISIMKGKLPSMSGEKWMRQGLVITQFSLSVIFIIGMLVVNGQLSFIQNKPLGYNRANLLTFEGKGSDRVDPNILISEIEKIPGVKNATSMAGPFLWGNDNGSGFHWNGDQANRNHLFKSPKIGYNTLETLELKLVAGRSYNRAFNDDRTKVIINESALQMMGLEEPIGFKLKYGDDEYREIIGVVEDFQYGSLHQPIEPLIFRFRDWGQNYMVRIDAGSEMRVIEEIEKLYKEVHPNFSFESQFLEDEYEALYASEQRIGSLSGYFAVFAIIISSLGLLGLVTFTTERRIKEIGIRKVLGCSVTRIVMLLSTDFTKLVLLAILIAIPLSYLGAQEWLQNFAYHIDLEWWYFAIGALLALAIAWLIISTKTIKAATVNPVESLKDE
ncbi:ABC transporter permease [Ekhidna sp.]|uniref:ABC transporter permease n=1 Tax=Ekhidna sp. TaxID=2608089 RepID=UPI003BA9EC36